jgi:NADH:ubiquinone oxidoreductase subunit C
VIEDLFAHLQNPAADGQLRTAPDGLWLDAPDLDVTRMATLTLDLGMRLSTMTGIALEDGETQLIYHFIAGSEVVNIKVRTRGNSIPSITPILPSANWIEREIHDLYAVEFIGHPQLERFIRPRELPMGFFREPGGEVGKLQREQAQKNAS